MDEYNRKIKGGMKIENLALGNKGVYVGLPILMIAFAEMLIYSGTIREGLWIHTAIMIGLFFSMLIVRNEEIRKTYQALMLLPILRLISLSIPVFFDMTLYSFLIIYISLAIPVMITAVNQKFTLEEIGINLKRIWLYLPLSVLISFVLAFVEYQINRTNYLIPDLSLLNLLKLTVVMVFFVGLLEEIIFRSILQTRLSKIFGAGIGIMLSSILFGLMHSGYEIFYEVIYAFFIGIIMGYLFYKTKSLPLTALIHGFSNVFLFGFIPYLGPGLGLL